MGTKNNPGDFDCYANAEPDEPMFVLLARDILAPQHVREWAYAYEMKCGPDPTERQVRKFTEARECADAMERWRAENRR